MWTWDLAARDDVDMAPLEQLEQDAAHANLWWYDPVAAGSNMILPDVATPTPGDLGTGPAASATVDGRTWDMVSGTVSQDVPTVEGTTYRALVRASAATNLTVETLDGSRQVVEPVGSTVNLLVNPSFEAAGDLSAWTKSVTGSATVTAVKDAAATDGAWMARLENPAGNIATLTQGGVAAAPTEVFAVGLDVVAASTTVRVFVQAVDAAGGFLANVASLTAAEPGRVAASTVPCPSGTSTVRVRIQLLTGDVGTVDVDAVQLEHGTDPSAYVDDAGQSGVGLLAAQWTAGGEPGARVTVDGGGWSGAQMFDVSRHGGAWRPGRGCPQVVLSGLSQSLLYALGNGDVLWGGAQVTLTEVDQWML